MTSKELDERIKSLIVTLVRPDVLLDQQKEETRQLIRDCIEAVKPEKELDERYFQENAPPIEISRRRGHNDALTTIEANTKELLG